MIALLNVAKNFQDLPHQIQALEQLDQALTKYPDLTSDTAEWVKTWRTKATAPASTTQMNQAGLALIKEFEGCELEAYLCPADVWTIGYGHTQGVYAGQKITLQQAEDLLIQDLAYFERQVAALVTVPLNPNQFAAIVSFCYNVGEGALADSTLLDLLNHSNYSGAADQFMRWVNGGGGELPGLVRRRQAERALFLA